MIVSHAQFMTEEQVRRTHEASLEILAETGLLVRNEKARGRFAQNGCAVDSETGVVKIPTAVVEEFRVQVPPSFTLHGRDPAFDFTVPRALPAFTTASSAPDVLDPVSGELRRATSQDIARLGHLVNELDGFDVFSISVLADDAPEGQFSLSRFYPALKNCVKPVRTSVIDVREAEQVLKLGALIAKKALLEFKDSLDPRRYNGAMFLGLNGICVKSHGGTDGLGFSNAIHVAIELIEDGVNEGIKEDFARVSEALQGGDAPEAEPAPDVQEKSGRAVGA